MVWLGRREELHNIFNQQVSGQKKVNIYCSPAPLDYSQIKTKELCSGFNQQFAVQEKNGYVLFPRSIELWQGGHDMRLKIGEINIDCLKSPSPNIIRG